MGIINSLVKCLQIKSTHNIQLKGLICLAECVHENGELLNSAGLDFYVLSLTCNTKSYRSTLADFL